MTLQRLLETVYFQPWSITPPGWQSMHAILKDRMEDDARDEVGDLHPVSEEDHDLYGNPLPRMEITPDGVAIIPILGPILHHASPWDKMFGCCSYDDIKANVRSALSTTGLNKIVFHVDSPGGMSMGGEECAETIAEAGRVVRLEAVTDSLICSAAYHIVSPCDSISCTPSAEVGCIGTLLPWLDQKVRYEMMGLTMRLFKSDELKGAGWPGTELSKEQEAYFQGMVDKYSTMFKERVRQSRIVAEESMRGQVFIGTDARDAGLVDEIVDDCELCFGAYTESEVE